MNYAIIENEEYAKGILQLLLQRIRPEYQLVFTADSIADTVDWLKSCPSVDLIFMDIELDDGNCFEIFEQVSVSVPIIFTTAYDNYAIKAFKVNSIDYLLKPIKEDDLLAAVTKFETLHPVVPQRILLKVHGEMTSANNDAIAGFVSENKIVYARMFDGHSRTTDFPTLKDVLSKLDSRIFFQLSRNVIVNIHSIVSVNRYHKSRLEVTVNWGGGRQERIIVSFGRRTEFLRWYGK